MIVEDRLRGKIDQIEKLLHFQTNVDAHQVWDSHIEAACSTVNSVIDVLSAKYPQFVKAS